MGNTARDEKKTEYIKFRCSPSFKEKILEVKRTTPGCVEMDLQQ